MLKTLISLVAWSTLLGLSIWQHKQDVQDRRDLVHYLQMQHAGLHVALEPCEVPKKIKNNTEASIESDPEQEQ